MKALVDKIPRQRLMPFHVQEKRNEKPAQSWSEQVESRWAKLTNRPTRKERVAAEKLQIAMELRAQESYGMRSWLKGVISATVLVIVAFIGGMIPGFYSMQEYSRDECLLTPNTPNPPEVMMWNKDQIVGTQIKILCSNFTHAPVKILMICDITTHWLTVVDNGCDCKTDPLYLTNLNLRIWDGEKVQGTKVKYNCSTNAVSKVVMETQCSLRRRWELISKLDSKCTCESNPPPLVVKSGYGLWTEEQPREVGTLATQLCVRDAYSPVSRAILCTEDGEWTVVGQAPCECLRNPPPPASELTHISYKGLEKHAIGSEFSYHCTKNNKSAINVTYRCNVSRSWSMDSMWDQTKPCKNNFRYLAENTFDYGQSVCRTIYGGQLYRIQSNKDRDALRVLLSNAPPCGSKQYFIGAVEDLDYQWSTHTGQPVPHENIKDLWDTCYPNNTHEKCVVVTPEKRLRTFDCYKPGCYVCEDPLCPDSPHTGNVNLQKPCYTVYDTAPNYFEVESLCRARRQTVAVVTDATTMRYLFRSLGNNNLGKCNNAYIGLYVGSRVWKYWDDELVRVAFWEENEPRSYRARCVVVGASSHYQEWKAVDCKKHKACSICEYTASVGYV